MDLAWEIDDISRGIEKQKIGIDNIKDIDNIADFIVSIRQINELLYLI